ncbi:MAG: type 1 glutamine amidotransferase, partial [Defluviimonas sp.]
VTMNAWHRDQVTGKPAAATRVGTSPFCENAALVYGDRAFTVQAHPEFTDDFVDGLMRTRGKGLVPDDLMAAAAARLGASNSSSAIADRIAAFFKANRN